MQKLGMSHMVVLRGKKGRQIFKKIATTKPVLIDHQRRAEEIRKKLEQQGVKF